MATKAEVVLLKSQILELNATIEEMENTIKHQDEQMKTQLAHDGRQVQIIDELRDDISRLKILSEEDAEHYAKIEQEQQTMHLMFDALEAGRCHRDTENPVLPARLGSFLANRSR